MATGFLNEHTSEFVIVPPFGAILATQFATVIPIHFWSTREGNTLSKQNPAEQPIRIAALFAEAAVFGQC